MLLVSVMFLVSEVAFASAAPSPFAQTPNSAQEKAASLRVQLAEVETRQAALQTRLQKLEEDLKPENIERSLAGLGSTHPEDERAQRRRQLEIERNGVQAQLALLVTSHTRLETAIARADADAYHQSAAPVPAATTAAPTTAPSSTSPSSTGAASEPTPEARTPAHPRRVRKKRGKKPRRGHRTPSTVR